MFLLTSSSGVVHENSIANTFGSRLSEKRDCTRWRHLLDSLESLVFWAFQLSPPPPPSPLSSNKPLRLISGLIGLSPPPPAH